jgi:hypothetical protein
VFFVKYWKDKAMPQPDLSADEIVEEIRSSAKENGWSAEDCKPKGTDSDFLRSGFAAFCEGRPYTDMPIDDRQHAKQWMIGWVGGEILAAANAADENQEK